MKDLYLRFTDAREMEQQLLKAGYQSGEDGLYHPDICTDIIGIIYIADNPDAKEPEYKPVPGWHVNLRIIRDDFDTSLLDTFSINPAPPYRVWA
ncbi:hypothetical protein [Superficieibacter sp.]|uniref:hypothetical protein n=1 Tax=Superficieibacter sp. TaxID=2303322 RepID=UPI0028AECB15|nr:hypothetical protein [Superficieibacter sp.]